MVGIVVVSHSEDLAAAVIAFARAMGGKDAILEPAGGFEGGIGTSFELITEAIGRARDASDGDGVVVLVDLGSALSTTEMAVEMDPDGVHIVGGPIAEGAMVGALAASHGAPLDDVVHEVRNALRQKQEALGEAEAQQAQDAPAPDAAPDAQADLLVRNADGIHARPVALIVEVAFAHDAELTLRNATTGRGPANARSGTSIAVLGAAAGHTLHAEARGPQAAEAIAALTALADDGFGDPVDPSVVALTEDAPAPPTQHAAAEAPAAPPHAGATLSGVAASPGLASGPVHHLGGPVVLPEGQASDADAELRRLDEAIATVRAALAELGSTLTDRGREQEAAIFAAQAVLLVDPALLDPARRAIREDHALAERAFHDAADTAAAAFEALEDTYLRERAADVRDVGRRVVAALAGGGASAATDVHGAVLVTGELLPGDAALLDPAVVAGVATAHGGATAHAAIIARSLGIPAVVGLGEAILLVPEGTTLVLDADAGTVLVDPDPAELAEHAARAEAERERHEIALEHALEPAVTRDGTAIEIAANLGDVGGAAEAVRLGAEGVGLLRSEFLFLDRAELPDEDEQVEAYGRVARELEGRPLIIRTLDVGADKPLRALPMPPEANPFLGLRGIRLALARPELLRTQLRAIVRVASEHPVRVMFPMVATLGEVRAARAILDEVRASLGLDPPLEVGVMVEVPGIAVQAERFAAEVDFFSIGTNDLSQYTMAAERGNEAVAALTAGPLPAVLRLVHQTVEGARAHGRWVGVCGELAGDVDAARLLVGLGVTELSMAAPRIADVKAALREIDLGRAQEAAMRALDADDADDARAIAMALADDAVRIEPVGDRTA